MTVKCKESASSENSCLLQYVYTAHDPYQMLIKTKAAPCFQCVLIPFPLIYIVILHRTTLTFAELWGPTPHKDEKHLCVCSVRACCVVLCVIVST